MKVFYDGGCGVCSREMRLLQKKAKQKNRHHNIEWINIATSSFNPQEYDPNKTLADFMSEFHVLHQGRMYTAMDGVRELYRFLGLGHWINWTAAYPLRPLTDLGYRIFARYRPRFSSSRCHIKDK